MKVGFIGLGDQGEPMAHRIAVAGWPLTLWARRPASLAPFSGVAAARSPRELAESVDVLCLCTFAEADLEEILFRDADAVAAGLGAGKTLVIHNTVLPEACRRIAARLVPQGVAVLDAPVAGGRERAFAGALAVMVGGEEDAFTRMRPILASYGDPIVHLGPLGSGQAAKILSNALMICNMQMADAAFAIGGEIGLSVPALQDLLARSSAASTSMDLLVAHDCGARQAHAAGPGIITKDIALFKRMCVERGVDMRQLYQVGAAAATRARALLRMG